MFGGTFPPPRPFQKSAHESLRKGVLAGHKNQMLMAPTGAGKTYLGLRLANEANLKGKRALFLCDRRALINQTSVAAFDYGMHDQGIIMGNEADRYNPNAMLQIASSQTLARRSWPKVDVIIVDEAHTQMKVWTDYIKTCSAHVIGLSATPFSSGLGNLFSRLINATTMAELTRSGVLVPMRVFTCKRPNMKGAKTIGGEWSADEAGKRGMEIIGDVVSEWKNLAVGRKTIVFASNISHCEEIARQFNVAGVMAAVFTSNTKDAERKTILDEYRKADSMIRVLVSVEALAKGFDVPDVSCVVDCRPLRKSISTAIQMWGRGLRSCESTGKTDCILLDHSGNIVRFAEEYEQIFHDGLAQLDDGEKLDKTIRKDEEEKQKKGCPKCGFSPFFKRCMSCGFEKQVSSLIEHESGEMVEFKSTSSRNEKQMFYSELVYYCEKKGYSHGWIANTFKQKFGVWPRGLSDISVAPSQETMRYLKHCAIRFARSNQINHHAI
jgi:DNA repair protein RadD